MNLEKNIKRVASFWLPDPAASFIVMGGDANTFDVWWLARHFADLLKLKLPNELPTKEIGVDIVNCVDAEFIGAIGGIIRFSTPDKIAKKGERLVQVIKEKKLLTLTDPLIFTAALFLWHGCICMAKLLREQDSAGKIIDNNSRMISYSRLKGEWEYEESVENPWLKFGVTFAKNLEIGRGNVIIDNWVPLDSPYFY